MLGKIFLIGVGILAVALVLNFIASKLNLSTWYDFVKDPRTDLLSYIWLFIIYPFCLGATAYLLSRLIDIN